jgi:hypothetical protein
MPVQENYRPAIGHLLQADGFRWARQLAPMSREAAAPPASPTRPPPHPLPLRQRRLLTELLTGRRAKPQPGARPRCMTWAFNEHPQRGSNPCLHLESVTTRVALSHARCRLVVLFAQIRCPLRVLSRGLVDPANRLWAQFRAQIRSKPRARPSSGDWLPPLPWAPCPGGRSRA